MKRKIGQVVLLHVGSNGIYNHQNLEYQFGHQELDLSLLNYVHISARNRTVPIRNFIIQHTPIEEYHVSFDKNSKTNADSSALKVTQPDNDKTSIDEKKSTPQVLWDRFKQYMSSNKDESLKPCKDSINCLLQYSPNESQKHNKKYSHPCRFSELCRSPHDHPHLEHIVHQVPMCSDNKRCRELIDPFHRAQYRHSDLPDFLVPCRNPHKCYNKSVEHRTKYSHGEKVSVLPIRSGEYSLTNNSFSHFPFILDGASRGDNDRHRVSSPADSVNSHQYGHQS